MADLPRKFLSRIPAIIPNAILRKAAGVEAIFPFYHIVSDDSPLHVRHLYRVRSIRQFESDLEYFLRHYHPISLEEVINFVVSGKPFRKPLFHLTFDDGLSECYDNISPILLQKGIPATFFLNPSFVDNKHLFFRFKASILFNFLNENPELLIQYTSLMQQSAFPSTPKGLFEIGYKDAEILDKVAVELGVNLNEYLSSTKPYMTSSQIEDLVKKGFSIGGHSMDHPYFSELSLTEQLNQIRQSIEWVNKHFNSQRRAFAFPFTDSGVKKQLFDQMFHDLNIELSFGGAGFKNDISSRHIQRLPMEKLPVTASKTLQTEYIYYLLKAPFGRNVIHRN